MLVDGYHVWVPVFLPLFHVLLSKLVVFDKTGEINVKGLTCFKEWFWDVESDFGVKAFLLLLNKGKLIVKNYISVSDFKTITHSDDLCTLILDHHKTLKSIVNVKYIPLGVDSLGEVHAFSLIIVWFENCLVSAFKNFSVVHKVRVLLDKC